MSEQELAQRIAGMEALVAKFQNGNLLFQNGLHTGLLTFDVSATAARTDTSAADGEIHVYRSGSTIVITIFDRAAGAWRTITSGAYFPLTGGNWKVLYSNGSGAWTELALGAAGTYLKSAGVTAAPTMSTITHAETTGKTANDHHNKVHDASDHADIPRIVDIPIGGGIIHDGTPLHRTTAAGTGALMCWSFATNETIDIEGFSIPDDYVSGGVFYAWFRMDTANVSKVVTLRLSIPSATGNVLVAGTSVEGQTATTATAAINDTANQANKHTINPSVTFTAGGHVPLNFGRLAAGDTASGRLELVGLQFEYTANQ